MENLTCISAGLSTLLPETLGKPMTETIDDFENLYMRKTEDSHEQMPLKSQETAEPQKGQFISVNELPETDI